MISEKNYYDKLKMAIAKLMYWLGDDGGRMLQLST